jgi:drug/metabolite transporter (DMT)-like permease
VSRREQLLRGTVWAAVAITVWSGSLVMLRLGVTTTLNAYDLTALRFATGAMVLAPVAFTRRQEIGGVDRLALVGMVAGFGAPYLALVSLALVTAPAAAAGSLNPGVMAVASVGFGWKFFGDRVGAPHFVGCAFVLLGASYTAGALGTGEFASGHLLLVLTGTMWASYAALVRRTGLAALPASAVVAVGSAVAYLPFYAVLLPKGIGAAPVQDVLVQAGFHGVLVSVVAVFGFNRSTELLGPTIGATLPALIPLVTIALSALLLDDSLTADEFVAAALVGMGVATLHVFRRTSHREHRTSAPGPKK